MTNTFQDIVAWKKAHDFVLKVYQVTRNFPEYERFGLGSQFQRAAVSIPANIAEGYRKLSKADKLRFFNIAQGSYIILSRDLGYINTEEYSMMGKSIEDASKMLNAYCKGVIDKDYSSEM